MASSVISLCETSIDIVDELLYVGYSMLTWIFGFYVGVILFNQQSTKKNKLKSVL